MLLRGGRQGLPETGNGPFSCPESGENPKKTAGERKFQPPTEMEKRLFLVRRTEKIEKIGRRAEKRYKAETDGHFFKSRAKIRKSFKHTICTF